MHRLVGEESIFNNPMEMVETVLSICKSYEVYNISAKLITRAYTSWHQYPVIKIENGCLYMNSVTGNLKSYLPIELLEEITIRYKGENEYYKAKYEDTLHVTTRYLDEFLNDKALDVLIRYEKDND